MNKKGKHFMVKLGTEPQHVHIDVNAAFAVVEGVLAAEVLSPVSFTRHSFASGGRTGCRWQRDTAASGSVSSILLTIRRGATLKVDALTVLQANTTSRVRCRASKPHP